MKKFYMVGVFAIAAGITLTSCKKEEKADCSAATKELTDMQGKAADIATGGKSACLDFVQSYEDLLKKYESCYADQKEALDQAVSGLKTTCDLLQ